MSKFLGVALVVVFFAVDGVSAQTLRYVNRSNPGASQLSSHRYYMGAQRRQQTRKFGYQRNASHRQRMSQLNTMSIQRTAGRRGTRTGTAAEVVAKKREQMRNRRFNRRIDPLQQRTTRLQAVTQQRAKDRQQALQRTGTRRKSRTFDW